MVCDRCSTRSEGRLFCPDCGRVLDADGLRKVRIMGSVDIRDSKSPKVQKFLETGEPSHLD